MPNQSEAVDLLKIKLADVAQECESETATAIGELRSQMKYQGGRFCVPDFQEAANVLMSVILCKEKRFNAEISRVLNTPGGAIHPRDLEKVETLVTDHFQEDKYLSRFDGFVQSVGRCAMRYSVQFKPQVYRVDLASALYNSGVKNLCRRSLASVRAELGLHIIDPLTSTRATKTERCIKQIQNNRFLSVIIVIGIIIIAIATFTGALEKLWMQYIDVSRN